MEREDLIKSLNQEFNKEAFELPETRVSSRFDAATATLYCGELDASNSDLQNASQYFAASYNKLLAAAQKAADSSAQEYMQRALFCKIARDCIEKTGGNTFGVYESGIARPGRFRLNGVYIF